MKIRITLLLIMFSVTLFSQKKSDNSELSVKNKLDYFLKLTDSLRQSAKNPGMAIAIVYNYEVIYKGGFGYRDVENRLPVTNNTLFEIASLTKAFTGVVASQLEKQGKLSWNDKVIKYIPEFKLKNDYVSKNVTLQDLFTHRTGLSQHYYLQYGPKFAMSEVLSKLQYLNFSGSLREKFLYNNFMYTVAGIVEERVSQKSWHELIQEGIFKPLGMKNTITKSIDFQTSDNKTISYRNDGKTVVPFDCLETYAPAGSIFSTIDDMSNWIEMLANSGKLNDKVFLTEKQLRYLTFPWTVRYPSDDVFYGIGWNNDKRRNVIYHRGNNAGQKTVIAFQPESGYSIVVLSNYQNPLPYLLEHYATKIFLENDFSRDEKSEKIIKRIANSTYYEQVDYEVGNKEVIKQLKSITGVFNHPAYGEIEITQINKSKFRFKYYEFEGTIKHDKKNEYKAYLNHFTGKDVFKFRILDKKSIKVDIPYSEPLVFTNHGIH